MNLPLKPGKGATREMCEMQAIAAMFPLFVMCRNACRPAAADPRADPTRRPKATGAAQRGAAQGHGAPSLRTIKASTARILLPEQISGLMSHSAMLAA